MRRFGHPLTPVAAVLCVLLAGCGGDDPSNAPENVTLEAYLAHNAAVDEQDRLEELAVERLGGQDMCSLLFKRPELRDAANIGVFGAREERANEMAVDACIEGIELEKWQDDDLDAQRDAEREEAEAAEDAAHEAGLRVAAEVTIPPDVCQGIRDLPLNQRFGQPLQNEVARALRRGGVTVPPDTTGEDVAFQIITACDLSRGDAEEAEQFLDGLVADD